MSVDAAAGAPVAVRSRRRGSLGGAWLLSGSMVLSGALAYAFQIVAARTLGADRFGDVAVLWGATFLVGIVLFRPLEQTVSRALADRLSRGDEIRTVLRAGLRLYVALALVATVGFAAAWSPLTHRLFVGDGTMTALLYASVVGYGLAYLVRGLTGGLRWFEGYGLGLLADGAVRLVVALPLVLLASRHLAGAAIAAAAIAGAAPGWVALRRARRLDGDRAARRFELGAALRFAAPASVIAGSDQLLVNGAPLVVMIGGGHDAKRTAGVVFAATMLVRVPVYVFQGLAASLLPNLTHVHAANETAAFRRMIVRTSGFLLAAGAAIVVGAAAFGPPAMRLLFGADFSGSRAQLSMLGAGVAFYLGAATISQALLAADRGGRAAIGWAAAAAVFVCIYALVPGAQLTRVGAALAVATATDLVLLALLAARTRST